MLTSLYTQATPLNNIVAEAGKGIFSLMLDRQTQVVRKHYVPRKSPNLEASLNRSIIDIETTDDQVNITINYPATIRFLDLKKTASGMKKRRYKSSYNKFIYRHIYGRGFSLSRAVNLMLQEEMENLMKSMKDAFSTI